MIRKLSLISLILFFTITSAAFAGGVKTGGLAPNFELKDINGKNHSLSDYAGNFIVLEWTNYDCPFVRKQYDTDAMQSLQEKYTKKGVVWLSINSSAPGKQGNFSLKEWKKRSKDDNVKATAILLDPDGKVGNLYDAKTTPHMFIINPDGILIYQGAIDNIPSADSEDVKKAHNYISSSLDEAMKGKPVSEPNTRAYGCSVKY